MDGICVSPMAHDLRADSLTYLNPAVVVVLDPEAPDSGLDERLKWWVLARTQPDLLWHAYLDPIEVVAPRFEHETVTR